MDAKKTGTTTLGLVYRDGVVLAADRRVTGDHIVVHKNISKIEKLSSNIGVTIAGMVSDVQTLVRVMQSELALHETRSGSKMSTKGAVGLLSTILYNGRRALNLYYSQFIIGGFDTKPEVYTLGEDGSQLADTYTVTGSGGDFALGVLEADYQPDLAESDAIKLAYKAVSTAIKRDIYTGEAVDIAVINKKGYKRLSKEDIEKAVAQ